ncbi:helix-turn-helix domain-containing protein [Larkinella terrae]|uniref:Helix-turn-helix domain-containing protein n=1 Tax=Larkinella terrae TaxID=2025311 RepID=A0A7K0EU32_9BACT|nr:helix-turn-helix transcriptional regulator [Larkinella terrae]MRS65320.1 helix-turn-helix domain-containing protein [Larkinella terrae]
MAAFVGLDSFYKNILNRTSEYPKNEVGHFNIFKVEDIRLPTHKPVNYTRRNFFKMTLVTGHSKIHYADQSIEVNGSVLVFTNPMIPYFWEIISEEQTGFMCIFTEAFFSRFGSISDYPVFQHADSAVIALNESEAASYKALFVRMLDELQGDYAYKYDLLRNLLMEVVHGAQKMRPLAGNRHAGSNAAERITGLFAELLERQFPIELSNQVIQLNTPAAFARQLNIHVNHLNKALKETTGQTTSQLISERVLQEAKILLKSTSWTIAEIAWSLGFEEPNHFSSFFKNRAKITAQKFRSSGAD